MNALKIAALAVLFLTLAAVANAQPQPMRVAPKTLIITVDRKSAETTCSKCEIKIKLITREGEQQFTVSRSNSASLPPFSVKVDNRKGRLGLYSGDRIEISTSDKRTWFPDPFMLPKGDHETLVLTCELVNGFWEISAWGD
jgi:hypothetical protein